MSLEVTDFTSRKKRLHHNRYLKVLVLFVSCMYCVISKLFSKHYCQLTELVLLSSCSFHYMTMGRCVISEASLNTTAR